MTFSFVFVMRWVDWIEEASTFILDTEIQIVISQLDRFGDQPKADLRSYVIHNDSDTESMVTLKNVLKKCGFAASLARMN